VGTMPDPISVSEPPHMKDLRRAQQIRRIVDARFHLDALEEWKKNDPQWWNSRTNDMGRGLYGQAMRELRRLQSVSEDELKAELAAVR
jgi:hypothetical protein